MSTAVVVQAGLVIPRLHPTVAAVVVVQRLHLMASVMDTTAAVDTLTPVVVALVLVALETAETTSVAQAEAQ